MAVVEFWRDVTAGSPLDTINRYRYDTDTDTVTPDSFTVPTGNLGVIHPPVGTIIYQACEGLDLHQFKSRGNSSGLDETVIEDYPSCCTLALSDFSIVRTNNTNPSDPRNGTIVITAGVLSISDYEASIDGGSTWVTQVDSAITFDELPAGTYTVLIRAISGVCSVTTSVTVSDNITYPPLIIEETTLPTAYAPVFHQITIGFTLVNNDADIKEDLTGTYIEVGTSDGRDYLATLPIIKIFDNEDYAGTYEIIGVDDPDTPTRFYIDALYTSDQAGKFVPFDRQVFQLFCERQINVFAKIADISVYPNPDTGEYLLRLESFLQSAFTIDQPINEGDEINLLRKYYVTPKSFDIEDSPTILNAVYSAIPDLTLYLSSLIPLGPAPINFIDQVTKKGLPVLFSYIDTASGRIKNTLSSEFTNIVQTGPLVFISGLPFNSYEMTWVNPAGAIGSLNVDPVLPDWITIEASPSDTVKLSIDTGIGVEGGDYDGEDYSEGDYLEGGPNAIVGCYTYEFFDDEELLFTLTICIYPIQKSNEICGDVVNIAWINREGGWSSYPFNGKKVYTKSIGNISTFKKGGQLRKSSVTEVYDGVEVVLSNKPLKDLQFISSLRQSIQAYMWSDETQQFSVPIFIDKANFDVYASPFKQLELEDTITIKIAEDIIIQTQ